MGKTITYVSYFETNALKRNYAEKKNKIKNQVLKNKF